MLICLPRLLAAFDSLFTQKILKNFSVTNFFLLRLINSKVCLKWSLQNEKSHVQDYLPFIGENEINKITWLVCLFVHTKIKNVAKTFQNDKSHVCSQQENCASEGGVCVSAKASKQLIKHCQMFFWFFSTNFSSKNDNVWHYRKCNRKHEQAIDLSARYF